MTRVSPWRHCGKVGTKGRFERKNPGNMSSGLSARNGKMI